MSFKSIVRKTAQTVIKYGLIEDGDQILIGFSGGKDSIVLTKVLKYLQKKAPITFDLHLVTTHIEPKLIEPFINKFDIPFTIIKQNIDKKYFQNSKNGYCPQCSRYRRVTLYNFANKIGIKKIALGHHLDDVIETYFLNQFYQGKLETIKPIVKSDNGFNQLIRPFHSVLESDILEYIKDKNISLFKYDCPYKDKQNFKRKEIKNYLNSFTKEIKYNIYNSLFEIFH